MPMFVRIRARACAFVCASASLCMPVCCFLPRTWWRTPNKQGRHRS